MIVLLQLEIIRAQMDDAVTADEVTRSRKTSIHRGEIPLEGTVGSNEGTIFSEPN